MRGVDDLIVWHFFVQAEDGIRELVRSRGLGDVYKRQAQHRRQLRLWLDGRRPAGARTVDRQRPLQRSEDAVSYTHLTLPTSDLV